MSDEAQPTPPVDHTDATLSRGIGVGATIGTAVLGPGIGTAVGLVAGAIVGEVVGKVENWQDAQERDQLAHRKAGSGVGGAAVVQRDSTKGQEILLGAGFRIYSKTARNGQSRIFFQAKNGAAKRWNTVLIIDENGKMQTRATVVQSVKMSTTPDLEPQD